MLLPCYFPASTPLLLCSWPNPGVLSLLPCFRSHLAPATTLLLLYACPAPTLLLSCSVPAQLLLLPFSFFAPTLLLRTPHLPSSKLPHLSSCPGTALLLPCSYSFPYSCSAPAYLPSSAPYDFFRRAAFYGVVIGIIMIICNDTFSRWLPFLPFRRRRTR